MSKETKRPSPKQIDVLIARFAELQNVALAAQSKAKTEQAAADAVKAELVAMVEAFGSQHTEKSKKLTGARNSATTTTATRSSVDDQKVDELRTYLEKSELPDLREKLFSERVTYQLVASPQEELKKIDLPTQIRAKIQSLLGLCMVMKTNAPSLKVDVPETA